MSRKTTFIIILVSALALVGALVGAIGYFMSSDEVAFEGAQNTSSDDSAGVPVDTPKRGEVVETHSGAKEYRSDPYGFAFQVPADFTVGEFDESGGRLLLVKSGGGTDAFQVFILPWDEPTDSLTPERIRQDVPDLEIHDPQQLPMSGEKSALTFIGESERFGTTREVWMVNDGWLFQVISAASDQEALQQILNTWRFI
ncbi:MAG: hypothetical protein WEC58_02680 [Candidatus Paceibacterota bacterium]